MVRIGIMASEEMFENVDGRKRTTDAWLYYMYKRTYEHLDQVS